MPSAWAFSGEVSIVATLPLNHVGDVALQEELLCQALLRGQEVLVLHLIRVIERLSVDVYLHLTNLDTVAGNTDAALDVVGAQVHRVMLLWRVVKHHHIVALDI
jgi:hypothetical protein